MHKWKIRHILRWLKKQTNIRCWFLEESGMCQCWHILQEDVSDIDYWLTPFPSSMLSTEFQTWLEESWFHLQKWEGRRTNCFKKNVTSSLLDIFEEPRNLQLEMSCQDVKCKGLIFRTHTTSISFFNTSNLSVFKF